MLLSKVPLSFSSASCSSCALYLPAVCSKWHIISRQPDAAFWAAGVFRWLRWHFSSLATKSSAHARHSCDAPRSVTSAGCSLQKESKSRPPLPCFWPCFAPVLYQTLFSNDDGNARGSLLVFPARRIRGLSRISSALHVAGRPQSLAQRSLRETFGAARNLGLVSLDSSVWRFGGKTVMCAWRAQGLSRCNSSFRSIQRPNDTKTHTSAEARRGENTNTRAHEPQLARRGANGLREEHELLATCFFLCPAAVLQMGFGGARQVDYRPAHARASSVPDLITGIMPLGAQNRLFSSIANSKNTTSHIIRSGGQPAHNTSHPMPPSCHLSPCAYHRLPLLACFPRYRLRL